MLITKSQIISLICFPLGLAFFSCSTPQEQKIIGKWVLTEQQVNCSDPFQDSIQKSRINIYKNGIDILNEEIASTIASKMTLVFFEDNRFAELSINDSEEGHYYLRDSNLIMVNESKLIVRNSTLLSLTDTSITLLENLVMPKHVHNKISTFVRIKSMRSAKMQSAISAKGSLLAEKSKF